ncbi:MAG: hypothetical protein JXD23_11555 [Spirochaetales bacterium]|nr:hypothetical protein [Spirochaetales bacterium]
MSTINIFLTYTTIGMAAALYYHFILRKQLLGKFIGALIVGLVGSFLSFVVNYLFGENVIKFLSNFNGVNVFLALGTAFFLLWVFSKVSSPK